MPLPTPKPGLVIRYDYLWSDDSRAGHSQGKDRPACILVAGVESTYARHVVLLAITHSEPSGDTVGVEIPPNVKRAIGLDEDRSWVIVSESNVDIWPTAGMTPIPHRQGEFAYGFIPPGLFKVIKARFLEIAQKKSGNFVRR
jgi:hypothetical protein